jgi:hypothetical protein
VQHIFEADVSPADRARSPFVYWPFLVPAGATVITVTYEYSGLMPADESWGGNTLDLGLFGPRGTRFGGADFRGWSGSFRRSVTITATDATPAYLTGSPAGMWNVMVGLYKIAPQGCHYRVVVDVSTEPQLASSASSLAADSPPAPAVAATSQKGAGWYKGDLHCHTVHSDGEDSLADLVAAARNRGLDFLGITEHNTVSHLASLPTLSTPDLVLLAGEEITTYSGHANVWGIRSWVDFRCTTVQEIGQVIEIAHRQGALFSVNHPKQEGPPWGFGFGSDLNFDCLEVWQAPFWVSNYQSLALWDSLLRQGRRVVGVGGSDLHRLGTPEAPSPYPLATPTTWVYASALTPAAILDGIRRGHVAITADVSGPSLEFSAHAGLPDAAGEEALMGDDLVVPAGGAASFTARVRGGQGRLLQLVCPAGVVFTAPVSDEDAGFNFTASPEQLGAGAFPLPYLRAMLIQPPEEDLAKEPAALMVDALANPIYLVVR